MKMIRKIIDVKAMDNFTLECEMENGEIYRYDMSFILTDNAPMIEPLKNIDFFKRVWLEYGALEWPNGFGIHGKTIVRDATPVSKKSVA